MKKIKHDRFYYEIIADESDNLEDIYQELRLAMEFETNPANKQMIIRFHLPDCYKQAAIKYYANNIKAGQLMYEVIKI